MSSLDYFVDLVGGQSLVNLTSSPVHDYTDWVRMQAVQTHSAL